MTVANYKSRFFGVEMFAVFPYVEYLDMIYCLQVAEPQCK